LWVCCTKDIVERICPIENSQDDEWIHSRHDSINMDALGSRRVGRMNIVREGLEEKDPTEVIVNDGSISINVTAWGGASLQAY
jgi:hypothetical protein